MTKIKNVALNLTVFLIASILLTSVLTIIITQIAGFGLNTEIADDIVWGLVFYILPSILVSSIIFIVTSLKVVKSISALSYSLIYSIAYLISLSLPIFIIKLNNLLSNLISDLGFIILLWTALPFATSLLFIFGIKIFEKVNK